MPQRTITLPMSTISKHTVSIGGFHPVCMNCGAKYSEAPTCAECGTVFVFAASEKMGPGVLDSMRAFAEEYGLELIGYSSGLCLMLGGGDILNEDVYALQ